MLSVRYEYKYYLDGFGQASNGKIYLCVPFIQNIKSSINL
jgi:hypothetical protein